MSAAYDLSSLPNPFREGVVQDAWASPPADVLEIHQHAFDACLAGIDSAAGGIADSLLISGAAGSGKTHLLTRVQQHLRDTAASAPDQVLRCVFVFVRLQTNPQLLWQHLRRRFVLDLMRRDQGVTQLQRLFAHHLGVRQGATPRAGVMQVRVLGADDHEVLATYLAAVAEDLALPRDLCVALEHLVCNRFVRDASAWLAGDSLPEATLEQLGVGPDPLEDREQAARDVVTALCRLAGDTLPIVFCFDQVEALQRASSDRDAFFRFGQMAADLHDADGNMFLITCVQSAVHEEFLDSIRQADRDRMAQRRELLEPLTASQIEKLVQARLAPVTQLAGAGRGRFYPLSDAFVAALALETPSVPRRVLASCARTFDELRHGRIAALPSTSEFLRRELDERAAERVRELAPADTTRILLQGALPLSLLGHADVGSDPAGLADLMLLGRDDKKDQKVAVSVRNEADGRSLQPRLKTLLSRMPRKDGARLVIVRDPRLPIAGTATKAREHLAALEAQGASVVNPTVEALAALAALGGILADAKSGDLANEGTALPESAVVEWLRTLRDDLLTEPVRELADALLTPTPGAPTTLERDLSALLAGEHAITVEAAAERLGAVPDSLLTLARTRTDRFLLLEGPPEVLVDVAGVAPDVEH